MTRPPLRYPVNHHLAQILERAVAIAAVAHGPLTGEIGLFNGDEPERPGQWPRVGGRFGDSWAAAGDGRAGDRRRAPGVPRRSALAGAPGRGGDRPVEVEPLGALGGSARGPLSYGLVEWARTSEADGFFVFSSLLAEGAWETGRHRLHYRFERTSRPEEQRISRFRVSAAAPRELDLRDHPLDHPHRRILGSGTRARARSACGRCWRSRTDGSARSAAGSSTSSRCMAGTTSGAAPWACVSRSAAGPIGWDATARR